MKCLVYQHIRTAAVDVVQSLPNPSTHDIPSKYGSSKVAASLHEDYPQCMVEEGEERGVEASRLLQHNRRRRTLGDNQPQAC